MAGGTRLTRSPRARLLALLVVVLLLHAVALQWLGRELAALPVLRPLPTPLFTRVLQQEKPVTVPVAAVKVTRRAPPRKSVVASQVDTPAAPAAPAEPAASAPQPAASAPTDVAQEPPPPAPEPAASAPAVAAASAPASPASAPQDNAALESWPADTRLNYRLGGMFRGGELHGSARVQWQRQAERYETRIEIDVTLLAGLVLTSQGEVTRDGLAPRVYEELRRSGPRTARFGDDITLNDGRRIPRPTGVQDTASQFVELSHRFATGQETLEVGRSIALWLARPGGVDLWTYDVVELETLQGGELGPIAAYHLRPRRIANPRGNITAEIWFAPSLQYLPVRIRVDMGSETFVDLMVEKIEQR